MRSRPEIGPQTELLRRGYHQDWSFGLVQKPVRGCAEKCTPQRTLSVVTDHDHGGVDVVSNGDETLDGPAGDDLSA